MEHYNWGLPVAIDLFCAGLGAGAFMLAVMAQLADDKKYRAVSITGALLAPWPVILGVLLLVVDLGKPLRFWEMLIRVGPGVLMFSPTSVMSIGTWLLTLFVIMSLLYLVVTLVTIAFPWGRVVRSFFGVITLPLALGVTMYTGVLLAASPNAAWNTKVLPFLFVSSAMATGMACVIFWLALVQLLSKADFQLGRLMRLTVLPIVLQLAAVIALVVMSSKIGVMGKIGEAGFSGLWWIGVVGLGLILPLLAGIKGAKQPLAALVITTLLMLGGIFMRYVILIAGQVIV